MPKTQNGKSKPAKQPKPASGGPKHTAKSARKAAATAQATAARAIQGERDAVKAANRSRFAAATSGGRLVGAEATAIAASIIAPDAFPPKRFQDGYDAEPTAPFEPKTITDIAFSNVDVGPDQLGFDTMEQWLFAFRDPRRGVIVQQHANEAITYYNLYRQDGNTAVTLGASAPFEFTKASADTGPLLHGPILYGGSPKDEASAGGFFPISYGDAVAQLVIGGLPASTVCVLTCAISDGDDEFVPNSLTATSAANGTCTWTFNNAALANDVSTSFTGYIRLDYVNQASTAAVYYLEYANNNASFRHLTLGSFEQVEGIIDSFRANGLGLIFTNTAPVLSRNGDVVACQIPKSISWTSLVADGFIGLASRPLAVSMDAKDGQQIFWKPTAPFDMQFIDVTDASTDSNLYSLNPLSDYLAICVRIPKKDGRAGKAQVHCNAEGRTSSPWFGLVMDAPGERAASAAAMDFVRSSPQVHENPLHVRDAINFLKKNRRGIGSIASVIAGAIPGLSPIASAVNAVSQI